MNDTQTGALDPTQTHALARQISDEINWYTTQVVQIGESYDYSQYRLVRRITMFETHTYPTGKFDTQGNYKFWYDGIYSRIVNEVKNIDFDTKDIVIASDKTHVDDLAVLIANLKLKQWLRKTGQDEVFKAAVEEGSGWGNFVFKKVTVAGRTSYERCDLKNIYVINQTAETLAQSPVIERHQYTASDLRAKMKVWKNVKEVLSQYKNDTTKPQIQSVASMTTVPYYDIYERNGEVCLADLKEAKGIPAEEITADDKETYVFARVIGIGQKVSGSGNVSIGTILFAEEFVGASDCSDIYEEFHRTPYKGRWFREGMYELLFDLQVRLNMIGNQLAQGLELASKIVLQSKDKLIVQNIMTDLQNGDIIRTEGLSAVAVEMRGFTQLVAEWNNIQQQMNDLANSSPIVTGEGLPQRMPFQVAALLNQNSNKLFDYIREKIAMPFTHMFEKWIVPDMVKDITAEEVLRLTGDSTMMDRIYQMIVADWYVQNLVAIGPHGQDVGDFLQAQKMAELKKRPHLLMTGMKQVFKDFIPSVSCVITGENSTLPQDMQTLSTFIALEQDPVRRTALIEMAMAKKGIDVASLPKSPPEAMQPSGSSGGGDNPNAGQPTALSRGKQPAVNGNLQLPARPTAPVRQGP